jgi:hypothetical protein
LLDTVNDPPTTAGNDDTTDDTGANGENPQPATGVPQPAVTCTLPTVAAIDEASATNTAPAVINTTFPPDAVIGDECCTVIPPPTPPPNAVKLTL